MKVITGHLTATDKKAIKAILAANLMSGKVGKKSYFISKKEDLHIVKIQQKDRGLIPCPGSELQISTYTHSFTL